MTDPRKRPSLPNTRATALFARTIFKELRRAQYTKVEMVTFVNDLLEQVGNADAFGPFTGVEDPESGLPNKAPLLEILEFQLRRARAGADSHLLLLCIDVSPAQSCPDDVAHEVQQRVGTLMQTALRPGDTAGRLGTNRYIVLLPNAPPNYAGAIADRLVGRLRQQTSLVSGADVETVVRAASWSMQVESAAALLEECIAARPLGLDRRSVRPPPIARAPQPEDDNGIILALGGGAARAAAHIGVLRALRDAAIPVKGIVATSAGAIVGAMAMLGVPEDQILAKFEGFPRSPLFAQMRREYARYRRNNRVPRVTAQYFRRTGLAFMSDTSLSAIGNDLFEAFIEFFVGPDRDISTLNGPFAAAATDLVEGRPVHFFRGPLHLALRATCAVPGLFPPQLDGERIFTDGSVVAEVPIDGAAHLGVNAPVLAVYLARPRQRMTEVATSMEVVTRANSLVHTELVRAQLRLAPRLLIVPVHEIGWLDFRGAHEVAAIGEASARAFLEKDAVTVLGRDAAK